MNEFLFFLGDCGDFSIFSVLVSCFSWLLPTRLLKNDESLSRGDSPLFILSYLIDLLVSLASPIIFRYIWNDICPVTFYGVYVSSVFILKVYCLLFANYAISKGTIPNNFLSPFGVFSTTFTYPFISNKIQFFIDIFVQIISKIVWLLQTSALRSWNRTHF